MGTQTLQDIKKDIKLLITTLTGLEEQESGFHTYEKLALSKINSHVYPTVNAQQTKKRVAELINKIIIHGKEDVANKLGELVNTFLTSFDFDRHPQSDLQWSLLTFLIDLSNGTQDYNLQNLNQSIIFNESVTTKSHKYHEEIDWGEYLKEGQEEFFHEYKSDTESEWSDDDIDGNVDEEPQCEAINEIPIEEVEQVLKEDPFVKKLKYENASKNWLMSNVQNSWWNELDWNQCKVVSKFPSANYCEFWRKNIIKSTQIIATVSEYNVIRELLWMLINPSQAVIVQEEVKSNFVICDNVTIPSLSTVAFKGILQPYSEYFHMLRDLEIFNEKLYKIRDDLNIGLIKKEPPLTYETYNAALQKHLSEIKKEIIRLEKRVMKQDQIHTLLSISEDLKGVLNKVKILYKLHKTLTDDLFVVSNENAVVKLLSGLYFHVQNAGNKEEMYIYTSLYLSSITVYLNIIDKWMSEGRLEDWREEFLISKNFEDLTTEDGFQCERFVIKPVSSEYPTDPLITLILQKVSQMGRSIDLLVTLGRMSELWISSGDKSDVRTALRTEFMNRLFIELCDYHGDVGNDYTDCIDEKMEVDEIKPMEGTENDFDHIVTKQCWQTDNLILLTAFNNFLSSPLTSNGMDSIDGESEEREKIVEDMSQKLNQYLNPILPLRKIIQKILTQILDQRYSKASKLVKNILMKEYKLGEHLKLMRCIYMMEMSHIMNRFIFQFFSQVESNSLCRSSSVLTSNLQEVLSEKWPDTSSRWTFSIDMIKTNDVLKTIDSVKLHYAIDWPINMLLNDVALEKYNSIFKFHLKLKWAHWTLSNLRFSDLECSRSAKIVNIWQQFYVKRLESLRFWLLHAIGSIHSYLCGQVLQSLAYVLENALTQAEDLDTIINLHSEFLDKAYEHCLQTDQFATLREIMNELFKMCIQVRKKWSRGFKMLTSEELNNLEKSYVKYHTSLAMELHNIAMSHENADSRFTATKDKSNTFDKIKKKFGDYLPRFSLNLLMEFGCINVFSECCESLPKLSENERNLNQDSEDELWIFWNQGYCKF